MGREDEAQSHKSKGFWGRDKTGPGILTNGEEWEAKEKSQELQIPPGFSVLEAPKQNPGPELMGLFPIIPEGKEKGKPRRSSGCQSRNEGDEMDGLGKQRDRCSHDPAVFRWIVWRVRCR